MSRRPREAGARPAVPLPAAPGRRHVLTLPASLDAVALAREDMRMAFTAWGMPAGGCVLDAAELIVCELVLNAVRHAQDSPSVHLVCWLDADRLGLAVHDDDSRALPVPGTRPRPGEGEPGCGLRTVAEVAARFGGHLSVEPSGLTGGKAVIARLKWKTGPHEGTTLS